MTWGRRAGETKAAHGRRLIACALEDGEWHETTEIVEFLSHAASIGAREARRLAMTMGVQHKREGYPARGYWRLPDDTAGAIVPRLSTLSPAEVRARLERRVEREPAMRAAVADTIHAILAAERAGDPHALADALEQGAARLLAWSDHVHLASRNSRRRAA
jgi:hypothetical protein